MAFRRNDTWTTVAVGAVLTLGSLATANAQAPAGAAPAGAQAPVAGQGEGQEPPPPYRPAKDAKDLRSVLFNWTWHLGMLRGVDEHELIVSLEYQGKGTVQVDGQPCTHHEVSRQHQLPDAGPADADHVHARQRADVDVRSKWSAGRTPGTKTFRAPRSSPGKARRRRWRPPHRSG